MDCRELEPKMHFKLRAATKEDCKEISRMILELAVYEKMPDQVKISHEGNVLDKHGKYGIDN